MNKIRRQELKDLLFIYLSALKENIEYLSALKVVPLKALKKSYQEIRIIQSLLDDIEREGVER